MALKVEKTYQMSIGSATKGLRARPRAVETALVNKKSDMTSDFMLVGALVYAYSRPVMDARISETEINT